MRSIWIEAELFSVKGGKFHKPAGAMHESQAWHPTRTACGLTVTPLNYFKTSDDADRYTGGRLRLFACKKCRPD